MYQFMTENFQYKYFKFEADFYCSVRPLSLDYSNPSEQRNWIIFQCLLLT